jgi:dipeptidyl aminopeptidase/acylaminoacyl peptidase
VRRGTRNTFAEPSARFAACDDIGYRHDARGGVLNIRTVLLTAATLVVVGGAFAQEAFVAPPPALIVDGIPPITASLATTLGRYGEFRPSAMLSWHPQRREILVRRRLDATTQVHAVAGPGNAPRPLTDFSDAVGYAAYQPTTGHYFVFARGEGGNEVFRLYRHDIATQAVTPLTPGGVRVAGIAWNRAGDRIVYSTQPVDRNNPGRTARTTIHLMDPLEPGAACVLADMEGGGWQDFAFSEDGHRIAFIEFISVNESHIWLMDLATGRRRRVTRPGEGEPVAYASPRFSQDGASLFAISDRGSEYRRLVMMSTGGGEERVLLPLDRDVDAFALSSDGSHIAFLTNEHGASALGFVDLANLRELPRAALPPGVIGGLRWRRESTEVAFHMSSARSAGDVYSYDVPSARLTRWTDGAIPGLDTSAFVEPRLIRWKSFDGRVITGFHYPPPTRFSGKRPVIINIHGGPEAQFRPGFLGRYNFFLTELGVAMIFPNVRGSTGFGKTFLKLDNGMKREDPVKDIGALLDWIAQQPDLDASRVVISGGSYGGYMTLASAAHFAERISGAVSVVGISNFVSFLERTESYRRDLRRAEYGDERDPAVRAFLESISPLNHAARIAKPLFVVQGLNDPRVPHTEAEQIVASLKSRGTPVWFLMAKDEGHGFVKKPNVDFQFYATAEFVRRILLK